jgi:hypothetical protein
MSGFNIGGYTSEKDSITVSSQDHAINEQGLPGNGGGGGPKKGKVRKPPIKITFGDGDGDRTTKPNGQDDGKIIAVPYLIFDLPKEPSDINLRKKKFHYKQLPVEIVTMSPMPEIRMPIANPSLAIKL